MKNRLLKAFCVWALLIVIISYVNYYLGDMTTRKEIIITGIEISFLFWLGVLWKSRDSSK